MALSVTCPGCEVAYRLSDEMAGKAVRCQKCGESFIAADGAEVNGVTANPNGSAKTADRPRRDRDWGDEQEPRRGKSIKRDGSSVWPTVFIIGGIFAAVVLVCGGAAFGVVMLFMGIVDEGRQVQRQVMIAQAKGPMRVPPPLDQAAQNAPVIKAAIGEGGVFATNNVLLPTDPMFAGKPLKRYEIELEQGKTYQLDLVAQGQFDAWLRVYGPNGEPIAEDDDSGGNLNSRIVVHVANGGAHTIHATVLGGVQPGRGNYSLTVRCLDP